MSFWRSDKFKSLYKLVQAFEFIRSEKGHKLNILKHDLLQRINIKNVNMKIIKNKLFLKVSGKMDCTIELSVFLYIF